MSSSISQFQTKVLKRSINSREYKLYRAALEWELVDPIVIENREDLKSEYRWRDRVEPYHHQVTNLITFCRRLPVTLLADDVGLGKTISAGLVASELISRGKLSKILIVCPKILREQWQEELKTKFDIPSIIATGRELINAKTPGDAGAVITTYQSARLYLDKIGQVGYEMLILDEAHKLRNLYGVDPTPQVAKCFRKALADRLFKYVLMLTATPIQNRLWDLYSLVDLLTVARGHENPFGNEGMFFRRFIADNRTQARQLKPEAQDEFRSIVYGYMSRIRRGDADLHFPDRIVKLHRVDPTPEEVELINIISEPIQKLNRLTQISILQALISSPQALSAQLNGMAKKGTIPVSLATEVNNVVKCISITAKLHGLGALIDELKVKQLDQWRMVVFTGRRETQTTIQSFFQKRGISCGLINGDSGSHNQETIAKFKKDQPDIHVIVSTEAGSEGINLQAANVLVNYDLPWNPMIVEQRIGRIQRLSSNFANVSIFNIVLKGTFEEYIVGRLMEKLQMASHAIGDIEALLEASGIDEEEENNVSSFEEKIRQLVVASLAGKDIKQATLKAEKSISAAKIELEREENNINSLLGKMDGATDEGPKCPKLPEQIHSIDVRSFVLAALEKFGAKISPQKSGLYVSEIEGKQELISFQNNLTDSELKTTLYAPSSPAFGRLVNKISNMDLHQVEDVDQKPLDGLGKLSRCWVSSFNGIFKTAKVEETWRRFEGKALVRVRATVACDSYERLVEVMCSPADHSHNIGPLGLEPINGLIENPVSIGVNTKYLNERAILDQGIAEFCRFYIERRAQELRSTGDDLRKKKKIEDDFTPRLEISLVGLEGVVSRQLKSQISYNLEGSTLEYIGTITLIPSKNEINSTPNMLMCEKTRKTVPEECLDKCEISGLRVLRHLLVRSELSGRMTLPDYITICSLSGKHVLQDEVEKSAVTGRSVIRTLLRVSVLSGKHAEPEFFAQCEFTKSEVLEGELAVSQISGKRYRIDEQLRSVVSGKIGHRQEFIFCSETNQPLLATEAETCQLTGKIVVPGLLEQCEVTGKKVLPSELEKSSVTGKKALKKFFVSSSISGVRILEEEAVKSATGKFCTTPEAKICNWSSLRSHPEDLKICNLTRLSIRSEYMNSNECFGILLDLLNGIRRKKDKVELWGDILKQSSAIINIKNCEIESVELSLDNQHLAICLTVKSWMGIKVRKAGLIYSIKDKEIVGRIVLGKRDNKGWALDKTVI